MQQFEIKSTGSRTSTRNRVCKLELYLTTNEIIWCFIIYRKMTKLKIQCTKWWHHKLLTDPRIYKFIQLLYVKDRHFLLFTKFLSDRIYSGFPSTIKFSWKKWCNTVAEANGFRIRTSSLRNSRGDKKTRWCLSVSPLEPEQ